MEPVFLNDWADTKQDGMCKDFGIEESELDGATIIVASYLYKDYEGEAYVLFQRDGKLWQVEGGHCSCFGLDATDYCGSEGTQWQPEEVSVERLRQLVRAEFDPFVGGTDAVVAFLATLTA